MNHGAGGCTAYDVVLILKRGRHDVTGCQVKATAERAHEDPKVFTKLHLHFTVSGRSVPPVAVERAIALSHEKYCSATVMIGKTAEVTTSFEVLDRPCRNSASTGDPVSPSAGISNHPSR